MQRNSNLEHLWDSGMPRPDKKGRGLMYVHHVPKVQQGGVPVTRDPGPIKANISHLRFSDPVKSTGIETFIPTPIATKSSSTVRNTQWTPQTRLNIYDALSKAGKIGTDMTVDKWNALKPEETAKYMNPEEGFDYTIGNSANPGGYKYWTRDNLEGNVAPSNLYFDAKKKTKYPTSTAVTGMRAKGGLLTKKIMSKKETLAEYRRDKRQDSSLRKPNEVPGAADKTRKYRQ